MKKIMLLFLLTLVPTLAFAKENESDYVETTKYYKTVYFNNEIGLATYTNSLLTSYTEEISKEEYDNYNPNTEISPLDTKDGITETEYKKMTTSIRKINSTTFRYKVNLNWKKIPSTRSYDIIGIGYLSSVTYVNSPKFQQNYCLTSGECYEVNSANYYRGTNGVGASFALPTENLKSLSQELYVDVTKTNSSTTISKQNAYGDYSHAQKVISESNSKKYTVDTNGINLNSNISSYYDSINTAVATWTGTW